MKASQLSKHNCNIMGMNCRQNIVFRSVRTENPDKQVVSWVDGQLRGRLLAVCTLGHKGRNLLKQGHASVQWSVSVVSNSLRPQLQHARPPCPSPTLKLAQTQVHWVGDATQPSHPLSSPSPPAFIFPSIWVFSNESVLHIKWTKYWSFSFSISPFNEYSRLISFRMDWLDLLAVQGTLKSLLQHHEFKSINSSVLSFLYSPTLTSIHD